MSKKLAEVLFANRLIDSDDEHSDSSESSKESEEYSHTPIKNLNFSLDGLALTEKVEMTDHNEEANAAKVLPGIKTETQTSTISAINEISDQIGSLMYSLRTMSAKQNQYDKLLAAINMKLDSSIAGSSRNQQPPPAPPQPALPQQADLFRIPDPVKSIPAYDGNRKQLNSWLTTAENTLQIFEPIVSAQVYSIYLQAVVNKIEGKAKDILCLAGNPTSFDEIKQILTHAIGDKQELSTYKSQLWQNKMQDTTSVHKYYQRTKEITQNIKTLSKQNETYRTHWNAINSFIDEDSLAAFISGLREPYFGYAQAARPKDLEDAYAFLCKFKSKEITANNMSQISKNNPTSQKFIKTEKPSYPKQFSSKPEIQKQEQNKPPYTQNSTQISEVDPLLKSRSNPNKKFIHNNEILSSENNSECSDEEDTNEINFWLTQHNTPET